MVLRLYSSLIFTMPSEQFTTWHDYTRKPEPHRQPVWLFWLRARIQLYGTTGRSVSGHFAAEYNAEFGADSVALIITALSIGSGRLGAHR